MKLNRNTIIKKMLLASLLFSLFPLNAMESNNDHKKTSLTNNLVTDFIKGYSQFYLVSACTTVAHELGHKYAGKLLLGLNSNLKLFPKIYGVNGITKFEGFEEKPFPKGLCTALMGVAGPLLGLGMAYCMLKADNIIDEIVKTKNLMKGIKQGIKKSCLTCFKEKPISGFQYAIACSVSGDIFSLVPLEIHDGDNKIVTDGAGILKALDNNVEPWKINLPSWIKFY